MRKAHRNRLARTDYRLNLYALEDRCTPATIAWDGGPTGNGTDFLTAANWVGDVLPGANDDVTIGATGTNPIISLRANTSVHSLTNLRSLQITGNNSAGSVTLTVSGGGTNTGLIELTSENGSNAAFTILNSAFTNAAAGTIHAATGAGAGGGRSVNQNSGGQLSNLGTVSAFGADLAVNANGAGSSMMNSGMLSASPGRTMSVSGGTINSFGGTFTGTGTVRFVGLTAVVPPTGLTVEPGVTLAITNSTVNGGGSLSLAAGATLVGESTSTINAAIASNGGTILVRGSLTLAGTTTTTAGSVLRVQGNVAFGSAVATVAGFANNGLIELTSENGFNATLTVSGGTLANAAAATIAAEAGASGGGRTVNLNGGQLTNAGTISASGADLSVNSAAGSSVGNSGMLRAAPGRVLAISGGSVNVFGGSVVGGGLVRLGFLTGAIASTGLAVDPDATLAITGSTVNGPGALSIAAGATLVGENSGTFNSAVSNNGGTILVRGSLTLAGDTTATAGSVLRVQGNAAFGSAVATVAGFANNGLIELTSENGFNATLTVSGGTLANAAAATIAAEAGASGGGRTVNLNGGQLTNAGTISASGADLSVNSAAGSAIHNTGVASSSAGRTLTYTGGVTSNFGGSIVGDGMVRFSNSTISLPTSGLTVGTSSTLALTSCTVNGPGGLSLTAGSTLVGENSATVNTAVTSNGATILVRSFLTLSGDTTTNANSILRVQGNAGFGSATAVVAGFTNEGLIELTSENGSNATLTVSAGTLVNAGTGFVRSTIGDSGGRTINLTNGSRLSNLGTISAAGAGLALNLSGAGATVTNSGTFSTAPGRTLSLSGGTFSNFSANTLTDGTYDIAGTFQFPGAAINTLAANLILTGTGSAILNSTNGANALAGCNVIGAAGQLVLAGFRNFTAAGAFSNSGTLLVNAGSTFVASGLTNAAGGTLAGNGTIALSLAGAGTVSPGTSPGTLTVVGTASLSGPLAIELNGTAPGTGYDQLVVNGTVNLSGATLDVTRNFVSQPGDSFVIVANDGTDAVSGTFAGLPEGATTTICGPQFRISYVGDTGNDIVLTQLTAGAPARVADVEVNAGQANQLQRSRVTTITVTFDQTVTFVNPGDVAAAFGLSRIGGGAVGGFTATVNVQGGVTVVTLSGFTGAESDFGSLADGRYSLTVRASQVVGLDGDGNGTPGDDYALAGTVANGLFRLFGDAEGNGVVNAFDYAQFRPTFGSSTGQAAYLDWLDFNGDGTINAFDFGQFRNRFGAGVP